MKKIIIYIGILILMPVFLMAQSTAEQEFFIYEFIIPESVSDNTRFVNQSAKAEKTKIDNFFANRARIENTKKHLKKQKQILTQLVAKSTLTEHEKSLITKFKYDELVSIARLVTASQEGKEYKNIDFILVNHTDIENRQKTEDFKEIVFNKIDNAQILISEHSNKSIDVYLTYYYPKKQFPRTETLAYFEAINRGIPIYTGDILTKDLIKRLKKENIELKEYFFEAIYDGLLRNGEKKSEANFLKQRKSIFTNKNYGQQNEAKVLKLTFKDFQKYLLVRNKNFRNLAVQKTHIRNIYLASIIKKHAIEDDKKIMVTFGGGHYHSLEPLFKYWDSLEKEKK